MLLRGAHGLPRRFHSDVSLRPLLSPSPPVAPSGAAFTSCSGGEDATVVGGTCGLCSVLNMKSEVELGPGVRSGTEVAEDVTAGIGPVAGVVDKMGMVDW